MTRAQPRPRAPLVLGLVLVGMLGGVSLWFLRPDAEPVPVAPVGPGSEAVARESGPAPAATTTDSTAPTPAASSGRRVAEGVAASSRAAPPPRDPRELVAIVLTPDGDPVDGVPLYLHWDRADGEQGMRGESLRFSGGEEGGRRRFEPGSPPAPPTGRATWANDRRGLGRAWEDVDAGRIHGPFVLQPALPDAAHLAVTIPLDDWPTDAVVLRLDAATWARVAPVRVEVHFADGAPAPEVPIALGMTALNPEFAHELGIGEGHLMDDAAVLTDADGVAWIDRLHIAQWNVPWIVDAAGRVMLEGFIAPVVPLFRPVRVPLAPDLDASVGVRIDLPEVGRIVGVVSDARGQPPAWLHPERGVRYRVEWESVLPFGGDALVGDFQGESREARFDIGWCGAGIRLEGTLNSLDGSYGRATVQAAGPRRQGEVVELRFDVGEPHPMLVFDVRGAAGSPLVDAPLEYVVRGELPTRYETEKRERRWTPGRTDGEGRLAIPWGVGITVHYVLDVRHASGGATAWGSNDMPPGFADALPTLDEIAGGRRRLHAGPIRLRSEPLPELPLFVVQILASGMVYDEGGQPLKGVRVLSRSAEPGASFRETWCRTDADGAFEVEQKTAAPFRLRVSGNGYQEIVSEVLVPGSHGLVFTMQPLTPREPGGRVGGQLLGIPSTLGDRLLVRVRSGRWSDEFELDREGRFAAKDVPVGRASVQVFCAGLDLEVLTLEELEVRSDQDCDDPRLVAVDLTELVRLHELRFERTDGVAFAATDVGVSIEGVGKRTLRMGSRATRDVLVPAGIDRLAITVDGFLPLEVRLEAPVVPVRLPPR